MSSTYREYLSNIRQKAKSHVMFLLEDGDVRPSIDSSKVRLKGFAEELLKERGVSIMSVFDVNELTFVGSGSHGSVFDCGNGKMLKITDDESEFDNSAQIVGMDIPHVVRVFKVARLKGESVYFIQYKKFDKVVEEKYPDLFAFAAKYNGAIHRMAATITKFLSNEGSEMETSEDEFQEVKDEVGEGEVNRIFKFVNSVPMFKKMKKTQRYTITCLFFLIEQSFGPEFTDKVVFSGDGIYIKYICDITQGKLNLYKRLGIWFTDHHVQNVAVDGDDFVLFDLGFSKKHVPAHDYAIIEGKEYQKPSFDF